jgi:hypothetical protein
MYFPVLTNFLLLQTGRERLRLREGSFQGSRPACPNDPRQRVHHHGAMSAMPSALFDRVIKLFLGASAAENEFLDLTEYYIQTDEYQRVLRGEVLVARSDT